MGCIDGVRLSIRTRHFSLLHCGQSGFEAHPTLYSMGTRDCFLGGKPAGEWSWPFAFIYSRDQECWSYTFTLLYALIAWRLIKNMENLTIILYYYSHRDIWKESRAPRRELHAESLVTLVRIAVQKKRMSRYFLTLLYWYYSAQYLKMMPHPAVCLLLCFESKCLMWRSMLMRFEHEA